MFSRLFGKNKGSGTDKEPPFSTLDGFLKCHRPEANNDLGKAIITETFPWFLGDDSTVPQQIERLKAAGVDHIIRAQGPPRRFSGDSNLTLPRGNYYTVCENQFGEDRQTLASELLAYTELPSSQLAVFCANAPRDREFLEQHQIPASSVVVVFLTANDAPNPVLEKLARRGILPTDYAGAAVQVWFPLIVTRVRIERVCDLRQPEMQRWIIESLPPGDDILSAPHLPKLQDFRRTLGSFMDPRCGGSDFTDAFGTWMRKLGANGIVFPSARVNNELHLENGKLKAFVGWNFVDFRGAPRMLTDKCVYMGSDWTGVGANLYCAEDGGGYAGSWRWEGLEAARAAERDAKATKQPESPRS